MGGYVLNIFLSLLVLSVSQVVVYLFFFNRGIIRYAIVKSSIITLVSLFTIFSRYGILPVSLAFRLAMALLVFFPPVLASMTAELLEITRKRYVINSFLVSLVISIASALLSRNGVILVSVWFILFYIYIIYILRRKNNKISSSIIEICIALNIPFLIASAFDRSLLLLSVSAGLSSLLTFFTIIRVLEKRNTEYINLYNRSTGMIKNLNHRITRLKQSSDHYKRIISEKDIEILQASRHASLAELTTGITHELAQPLTGIRGIAQNMIDDIEYGEFEKKQAETDLVKICSLVDKSASIIDHVRNFTKKSGYSMRPVDINRAIINAIDLVNIQLKRLNIDIVFQLDEDIPLIMGDNISLEQLIVNIIQNARDAIIEKKEHVEKRTGLIRLTTSGEEGRIYLRIEDNGIGIPEEIIHKIWSPFFTSKKRTHGTGIGLSISNKILKAHSADVEISTDSHGTAFTFIFPAYSGSS